MKSVSGDAKKRVELVVFRGRTLSNVQEKVGGDVKNCVEIVTTSFRFTRKNIKPRIHKDNKTNIIKKTKEHKKEKQNMERNNYV